ncbi:hypothetical protein Pla8534_57320 [Lignipirellula cremea]|uniref:Chromosome partition protein Smc n=2 Tax=Lignipirellula cremea TaxID=2528010 RepID=A0A518E1A7_9BACT|nr:hypothetical protein Pla8534_57320 [Lignipirellula cremea]
MAELEEQDAELNRRTLELAERCRNAEGKEREKLEAEVRQAIERHFEVRQKRRQLNLESLGAELERLGEAIEKRNAAREEIIQRRQTELLGQGNDLEF